MQGGSRTTNSRGFVGGKGWVGPAGQGNSSMSPPPRRRALPEMCFPGMLPHLLIYQGEDIMACSDPHSQAHALLRHRGTGKQKAASAELSIPFLAVPKAQL